MDNHSIICVVCGIEFEDLALWKVEGPHATICPVCRVTSFAAHQPEPAFLPTLTTVGPTPNNLTIADEQALATEKLVRSRRLARWVVGFVAFLFVGACGLPAVSVWEELPPRTGLWCLVLGVVSFVPWFPNPLLLFGSVSLLRGRNRTALVAGLTACLCSVPVFLYMVVGGGFHRMHSGYFLWQADIFVFSVAAFGLTKKFGEKPGLVQSEESKSGVDESNPVS
jgi:hypothetical protein